MLATGCAASPSFWDSVGEDGIGIADSPFPVSHVPLGTPVSACLTHLVFQLAVLIP